MLGIPDDRSQQAALQRDGQPRRHQPTTTFPGAQLKRWQKRPLRCDQLGQIERIQARLTHTGRPVIRAEPPF